MSDDFEPMDRITVRPGDDDVPYTFEFPICSSAVANDGVVPYDLTILSAAVAAHKASDEVDATAALIVSSALNGTVVAVDLQYPAAKGTGIYHLVFTLTFSDGAKKDYVFERIYVV